jgi:hypothetical protein
MAQGGGFIQGQALAMGLNESLPLFLELDQTLHFALFGHCQAQRGPRFENVFPLGLDDGEQAASIPVRTDEERPESAQGFGRFLRGLTFSADHLVMPAEVRFGGSFGLKRDCDGAGAGVRLNGGQAQESLVGAHGALPA